MIYKIIISLSILLCLFSCSENKSIKKTPHSTKIQDSIVVDKLLEKQHLKTTDVLINYDSIINFCIDHQLNDFPELQNIKMIKQGEFEVYPLSHNFMSKLEGVPLFFDDSKEFYVDEYVPEYYLFMMNDSLRKFKEIIILAPSRVEEIFYKALYTIVLTQDNHVVSMALIGKEISEFSDFQFIKHKQSIYPRSVKDGTYQIEHLIPIESQDSLATKLIIPKFPTYQSTIQHITFTDHGLFIDRKEPMKEILGKSSQKLILEYPSFTIQLDSMDGGDTYFVKNIDTIKIYFSDMDDGFQQPSIININYKDSIQDFSIEKRNAHTLFFNNDGSGGIYQLKEIPTFYSEFTTVPCDESNTLFFTEQTANSNVVIPTTYYEKANAYVLESKDESLETRRGYYSSYVEGISHTEFIISYTQNGESVGYTLIYEYSYGD